jgi:hypothetical protein
MPPMIVAPEREVPGISAKHCAIPTFSASSHVIAALVSTRNIPAFSRFDQQDHDAADDEGERHRHRVEENALDVLREQRARAPPRG